MENNPQRSLLRGTLKFVAIAGLVGISSGYMYYQGLTSSTLPHIGNSFPSTDLTAQARSIETLTGQQAEHASLTKAEKTPFRRLATVPNALGRQPIDSSGFTQVIPRVPWSKDATLKEIGQNWKDYNQELNAKINSVIARTSVHEPERLAVLGSKASLLLAEGNAEGAYDVLLELRAAVEANGNDCMQSLLGAAVFFQGVAALRLGENENCVMCRGESSCILPLQYSAVHKKQRGSRLAVEHFTEYLEAFPRDMEVRWLLNLAHMTLGEYPDQVDPRYLVTLGAYDNGAEFPRFKDVAELAGVNRFDQAGGAIMDDFNGDGLLDLFETTWDLKDGPAIYRNMGDGTFSECIDVSLKDEQRGGLQCMQLDYNNDGLLDIYVVRGAWIPHPVRGSLLRNDGDFKFTDVTAEAGLLDPVNSNSAQWADFDNDGWIDLFVCCERQAHRLYRNLGNGKFSEIAAVSGFTEEDRGFGKGCTWIDYDNDNFQDLFINYLDRNPQLFRNNGDGKFTDVSEKMGIDGPGCGFTCWTWDFNNDGWLDIFATSYERTLEDIVNGMVGLPHNLDDNRLFLNENGKHFRDVTEEVGLNQAYSTMGANFADLNNDGWLDFYLGTGEPSFSTLVPNRMFKNVGGKSFAEVTVAAGVGHLQKGHAVACGDWDNDGDNDVFIQMGGAVDGDKFRNILFANPGTENSSITLKLVGTKSNSAAIGARIEISTHGSEVEKIYRQVDSGSSFGANSLTQTIGVGTATSVDKITVIWPTSGTRQEFTDVPIGSHVVITEGSSEPTFSKRIVIPLPKTGA